MQASETKQSMRDWWILVMGKESIIGAWRDRAHAEIFHPEYRHAELVHVIEATPAALAASPEVQAMIREAEARGMERAAEIAAERWASHMTSADRLGEFDDEKSQRLSEKAGVRADEANAISERIRSLADTDGLALVQALRAERDGLLTTWAESRERHLKAEAERDDALTRLAAAEAQVGALTRASGNAAMYLESGFINCPRCGEEVPTKHTDAEHELRAALASAAGGANFEVSMQARAMFKKIAEGQG